MGNTSQTLEVTRQVAHLPEVPEPYSQVRGTLGLGKSGAVDSGMLIHRNERPAQSAGMWQ